MTMVEEQVTQDTDLLYSLVSGQNIPNIRLIAVLDGGYSKRPKRNTRRTSREFPLNTHVNA